MPGEDGLSHPRSERHGANVADIFVRASSDFGPCSMSSIENPRTKSRVFFRKIHHQIIQWFITTRVSDL